MAVEPVTAILTHKRRLTAEIELPFPVEQVFPFFAAAENLERITPPELRFTIAKMPPSGVQKGSIILYRLSLYGFPFAWRTLISAWDPPNSFVDEQLRGPYRYWRHEHTFRSTPTGTRIVDTVDYVLPFFPLSELVLPIVRIQLRKIFTYRQEAVAAAFGIDADTISWRVLV